MHVWIWVWECPECSASECKWRCVCCMCIYMFKCACLWLMKFIPGLQIASFICSLHILPVSLLEGRWQGGRVINDNKTLCVYPRMRAPQQIRLHSFLLCNKWVSRNQFHLILILVKIKLFCDQYDIDFNANKGLELLWTVRQTCSGHVRQADQLACTTLTKFTSIRDWTEHRGYGKI